MLTPSVSTLADYNSAVLAGYPTHARLVFPVQNVTLTDDDISAEGGILLTQMFNPDTDLSIGSAVSAEVVVHLLNGGQFTGFDWTEEFHLDFGVEINNSTEWVTVGYFKGKKPKRVTRAEVIEFTAVDRMQLFDTLADEYLATITYPATLSTIYSGLCTYLGLTSVTGDETVNAMAMSYTASPFSPGMSCRSLLAYIAEMNCCYARINANGNVQLRWFSDQTSSYSLTENQYYSADIDESTAPAIDSVRISSTDDVNQSFIYPVGGNYVIYESVDNPLLIALDSTDRTTVITDMITRFTAIGAYTPVVLDALGNWMVEAGDIIEVQYDSTQTVDVPVFVRTLAWNGGCEDEYESTGNTEREGLPSEVSEKYEIGAKVADKYTIRSGVDITNDGITVSGGKWIKLVSGGVLDVQSTNFIIDSVTGKVGCGDWMFNSNGLAVRKTVEWTYSGTSYSAVEDMYFGKNTVDAGARYGLYINQDVYEYNAHKFIAPVLEFGATDIADDFSWKIKLAYEYAWGDPIPNTKPGNPAILPINGAANSRKWLLGGVGNPFYQAFIEKLFGGCVQNNLTTTTEGYALDARQGKVLNDSVVHLTGTETITGQKNFSGNTYFMNHTISPRLYFMGSENESTSGALWCSNAGTGSTEKYGNSQFLFYEYSPAADGSRTSYYEVYRLPAVDTGRTASTTLDILTTKNAVTVGQGGTGADNAEDARSNLGFGYLEFVGSIGGATAGAYTLDITGNKHYAIYVYRASNGAAAMGLYLLRTRMQTSGNNYYNLSEIKASTGITSIEVTNSAGSANGKIKVTTSTTSMFAVVYRIY